MFSSACPHCGGKEISLLDRLFASYVRPIVCARCGRLSLQARSTRGVRFLVIAFGIGLFAFMFAAPFMLGADQWVSAFLVICPLALTAVAAYRVLLPLRAVSGGEVKQGRRGDLLFRLFFVLAAVLTLVVFSQLVKHVF